MISILPLTSISEIQPRDDLPAILAEAVAAEHLNIQAQDILVVSQKIVSKSENLYVDLGQVVPSEKAMNIAGEVGRDPRLVEVILGESLEIIRISNRALITRHRSGHVMANSGVDQSNLGTGNPEHVLLLPRDPDLSATRIRAGLAAHFDPVPAVIIADSFGRPWRQGVVNVAIGAAGLPSLLGLRGTADRDGRPLQATNVALGDIVACAAGAVFGEAAEGVPAALVRGLRWCAPSLPARAIVRPLEEDLFR